MTARLEPGTQLRLEEIALSLAPFTAGHKLSEDQLTKIRDYTELLLRWNRSMSLTALDDPHEVVTRHFGESILAAFSVPIRHGRLADVGSGPGFPGLPLKIVSGQLEVALLEPNQKKCAFLIEVRRELKLEGVEVDRFRFEEFRPEIPFDFVCARALGDYRRLLRWARTALSHSGRIILWLGEDESNRIGQTAGWLWELPLRIPESIKRVILVGCPQKNLR